MRREIAEFRNEPLTGFKQQPKRAMLNFYADVLATDGK